MSAGVRAMGLGLAMMAAAPAWAASQHHHHDTRSSHHAKAAKTSSRSARSSKHAKPAKPSHPDAAAAKGVLSVPAGGIKLFCGPGHNPLLIRKMTQGNGTTVTVVCR